eukprot:SAG31_NODE_22649_length_513_cov_2.864608_1_plen_88_part_01
MRVCARRHVGVLLCLAVLGPRRAFDVRVCVLAAAHPCARKSQCLGIWGSWQRCSVAARPHHALYCMVVTLETSHDERSPLKADAWQNT